MFCGDIDDYYGDDDDNPVICLLCFFQRISQCNVIAYIFWGRLHIADIVMYISP